jgi:hypothetical protein
MSTWFEDYLEAWNAEDVPKVMAWMADDITYEDTTVGHIAAGQKAMTKFVEQSFAVAPGARFEFVRGADNGSEYFIEWIMHPMGVRGVSVGTRSDGLISSNRDYWDGRKYTIAGG